MEPSLDAHATPSASPSRLDDDDLDPAAFLKTVRELSERRDREDQLRLEKLQEEVEKSRAERARRKAQADSAHTLFAGSSDNKSELRSLRHQSIVRESNTPPPMSPSTRLSAAAMDGTQARTPSPTKDVPEFKGFGSVRRSGAVSPSPAQAQDGTARPSQSATSLARSGTLSWQQRRPGSRGGSRPASVVGGDSGHARTTSTEQAEPSRDQIAASLGSRDPSYFRQTADRGVGSAAYRKSKDEAITSGDGTSGRRGLPGLSREAPTESTRQSSPAPSESVKSETASRTSGTASNRFSATTSSSTPSKPDLKSLLAEDEHQQEASPMSDHTTSTGGEQGGLGRTLSTMSSSQARLAGATERPSSPTKGMGGFVQSAMMKRNDSVSKRWSAQPGASLSRQNSVVSQRSGYGGLQGSHSMPKLEPTPGSRETSNEPASRPTSSSSNMTAVARGSEDNDGFVKPALPSHHSRSKSVASFTSYTVNADEDATSPPSSPSKRFSPTKSSWIESALTRPESSKPPTAKNAQPGWMANIAKAKAERASAESTPRTGTPKLPDEGSQPSSPTKSSSFGQSMLRRSESGNLAPTPRSSTPQLLPKTPTLAETPVKATPPASPRLAVGTSHEKAPVAVPEREVRETEKSKDNASQSAARSREATAQPVTTLPDATTSTPKIERPVVEPIKSPPLTAAPKSKPEMPTKPQTDFRSTLRSRAPAETRQQDAPEFLSKFGQLKKTQTKNFVAPDVFGNNIKRGKSDLARTDGPVKTERRDELKESLLAKKEDWKSAKEEGRELPGQVHERKISGTPVTPSKPEALAKKELLGRSESGRLAASPEKAKEATPEALARQRSLQDKTKVDLPTPKKEATFPIPQPPKFESLSKQKSAPPVIEHPQPTETSRLAARFNPGLAGMLVRGPPPATNGSNAPSRTESPALPERSATPASAAVPEPTAGAPLQDMRKGRARGPKKRKGGAATDGDALSTGAPLDAQQDGAADEPLASVPEPETEIVAPTPLSVSKARAPPGSAASIMMSSLRTSPKPPPAPLDAEGTASPARSSVASSESNKPFGVASPASSTREPSKPSMPVKRFANLPVRAEQSPAASKPDVPDFGGFGSKQRAVPTPKVDDDKENVGSALPSVRSAASRWGRPASPHKANAPPQIQLPSRRDDEAAMRSAGLLASSPGRSTSGSGLGIVVEKSKSSSALTPPGSAGLPPRPAKSSRIVSGQLQEASPNKGPTATVQPETEVEHLLYDLFGTVPTSDKPLAIDVRAVLATASEALRDGPKTLRRSTQEVLPDGTLKALPQQEECTFFDESVYICSHTYAGPTGIKKTQVSIWIGDSASHAAIDQAHNIARRLSREGGSLPVRSVQRGHEDSAFLQAAGGILVTRRGARRGAPKQYMLCGRKHIGHITFDELDFGTQSLCSGFVYLISYPVTLQQTKLYLWKGSACSTEEISAARLTAMDLSETGEIIEVDDGAEFASFLKVFGADTTKSDIPKPSELWKQKALAADRFTVRLFRIKEPEQKVGLFASMFTRRPSWNSLPSSRSPSRDGQEVKVEARHISPFTQSDLEAEGIYVLDAFSQLYVLPGPLFASQPETMRDTLLAQALQFAEEYAKLAVEIEERPGVIAKVLPNGFLPDARMLFRHWDEGRGLWGTAGLMAGSQAHSGDGFTMMAVDDLVEAVCRG